MEKDILQNLSRITCPLLLLTSADGPAGIKSLLAKSIAKEEGSRQPAQYVAKEDVVETESTLPIRPNTKSCELPLPPRNESP